MCWSSGGKDLVQPLQLVREVRVVHEALEYARDERLQRVGGVGLALLLPDAGPLRARFASSSVFMVWLTNLSCKTPFSSEAPS